MEKEIKFDPLIHYHKKYNHETFGYDIVNPHGPKVGEQPTEKKPAAEPKPVTRKVTVKKTPAAKKPAAEKKANPKIGPSLIEDPKKDSKNMDKK
jgi:hypothetical protein